jgi:hypothetical protein
LKSGLVEWRSAPLPLTGSDPDAFSYCDAMEAGWRRDAIRSLRRGRHAR